MKFLCDRCKTRYSIGDDRVRGKILKIRCKNCANVITVREGMPEPDAGVPAAAGMPRRNRTTTAAPMESAEAPAAKHNGARSAIKPPPALEEEWYVSIDGDQSGPFSLVDAQRWVGNKPFDTELHCWSEGFDDWLPVDKVSHFRGLRKKPAPPVSSGSGSMPPPIPRIGGTGPARALTSAKPAAAVAPRMPERVEDEPKPLFAATMASLEKSAPVVVGSGASSGGAAAVGALRVEARAPAPSPVSAPAKPHVNGGSRVPNLPAVTPTPTARGIGLRTSPGVGAAKLFDPTDFATQAEAPAFQDEQPTTTGSQDELPTKPSHLKSVTPAAGPNDAFLDALAKESKESKETKETKETKESKAEKPMLSMAAKSNVSPDGPTLRADEEVPTLKAPDPRALDDDDMEIGEVSRVVKLADIMRPPSKAAGATASAAKRTNAVGAVGRVTGPVPKINGTGAIPLIAAVDAAASGSPMAMEPAVEPAPEHHSKRGMILLLVGAALLLGVAAVIVVMKLNTSEDVTGLGGQYEYNPERPDDPIRRPGDFGPGSAEPQNPFIPKPPKFPVRPQTPVKVDPPQGNSLKSDEIEAMARSTSTTTTACFRRASKGVDDIILADVKKIRVAFRINPDGSVAAGSVDLSEKRSATLMSCIQRMVSGWKFRPNAGGDFGFVFAKPD